ncbi:MAG: ChrR family anti-sigma-E factor [Gammaproteobacteria bacterium]|nr:ChrR family anti-sigma-E factor [Gammaproteobacteria bacterium]
MTSQTNHHPSQDLLRNFSGGQLSTGMSVAVSAHLEYCGECRQAADRYDAELATEWLGSAPSRNVERTVKKVHSVSANDSASRFTVSEAMLDGITDQPQVVSITQASSKREKPVELHMHERSVRLPRVLAKVAGDGVIWRKLAGGINTAKLTLDRDAQCDFLYMKPGSQAPSHTHHGVEVTLVLDGTFEDELGEYVPGDFVLRESSQTHTPRSNEGCLCYSVLDSPLLFTSGWSKLLNPFQRYFFNRQLRQGV